MSSENLSPEPPTDLPEKYPLAYSGEVKTDSDPWWLIFNNPALDQYMAEVFQGNLNIQQGIARISQLRALADQRRSAKFPQLNLDGSGGRNRQPEPILTSSSYSTSLSAGYEIDLWRRLSSLEDAARFREKASEKDLESLFLTLSSQTAETWYTIALLKKQLNLLDKIIQLRRQQLEMVRDRYNAGLLSSLDLYQVRQSFNQSLDRRNRLNGDLEEFRHALAVLAGNWPGNSPEIPPLDIWALPGKKLATGLPADLLQNRPDVKSAFLQLQAADREIAAAVADRLPSFSLAGEYGGSSAQLYNVLSQPNILWNLLLSAAAPLVDGGRRKAEVERNEAVWRERLAVWHQNLLTAFQDVSDALARIKAADQSVKALREQAEETNNTLKTSRQRYRNGLDDYLSVITASLSHLETLTSLAESKRAALVGRISLARALGGKTE